MAVLQASATATGAFYTLVAVASATDLSVKGLRKSFTGTAVLRDVSFNLRHGESVALIGANGSGKSTLLRCCLRLVEPDNGTIALLGEDVRGMERRALRRLRARIGFVFQRHNLVPRLSALSNVVHGAQARLGAPQGWLHSLAPKMVREEAMSCLERVGLVKVATERVDRLSGGQSQRVAIARALMQRPRIVFADEPVASLDPRAGEEAMELFASLMRDEGVTLLFTSHDLRHALTYSERILGLRNGVMELDSPTAGQRLSGLRQLYA